MTPTSRAAGPIPTEISEGGATAPCASCVLARRDGFFALVDKSADKVVAMSNIPADDVGWQEYWSGDRRRVMFSSESGIYVWDIWASNDRSPRFVLRTGASYDEWIDHSFEAAWSPNGHRLAIFWEGGVWIFDAVREELSRIAPVGTKCPRDLDSLSTCKFASLGGWYTDEVVEVAYEDADKVDKGCDYHDARTGKLLLSDLASCGPGETSTMSLSPDARWWAVRPRRYRSLYVVYDLRQNTSAVLSSTPGNDLRFLLWSTDSGLLFFVSRPWSASAQSDPNTPFGLLTYDPVNQTTKMLFEQAAEAFLSPDQRWALVAFPSRQQDGHLALAVGLWRVGTAELLGQQILADQMLYAWPAHQGEMMFWAEWSGDGRTVRFRLFGDRVDQILEVPEQ